MPQEHYVLRCFSCETFQAHIVKKSKKWECKMCGEKQSVKRNYGRGSAKDCRNQVMKLNQLRLEPRNCYNSNETDVIFDDDGDDNLTELELKEPEPKKSPTSKWAKYLDEPVTESNSDVDDSIIDMCVKSEKKKKRQRNIQEDEMKSCFNENKKICTNIYVTKASSPVKSQLLSSMENKKNVETCKSTEMKYDIQVENKLNFNKYSKYLDEDGEEDNKNDFIHASSLFDSDLNDLDDVLGLK